jgi:hypothetical protein
VTPRQICRRHAARIAEITDIGQTARYGQPMKKFPVALALSAIFVIAGCSSGSSGGSATVGPQATDAASKAAATTQIKANWATFFNSATPQATAVGLLENGATLGPAIKLAARVAKAEKTKESAVVTKIVFADSTHANIIYNLLGNGGKPLLANSDGKAVLQNGKWKVAQTTFCTLADLGAQTIGVKTVPGC